MAESPGNRPSVRPPSLDDLTSRYLATTGSGSTSEGDADSAVVPFDATGCFRLPARAIWDEAFLPLRLFGVTPDQLTPPPDWSAIVQLEVPQNGIPMAAGLVPQLFRLSPQMLSGSDPVRAAAGDGATPGRLTSLRGWVRKAPRSHSATTLLVAAGLAALLGETADAEAALTAAGPVCTGPWKPALLNQRGAVAWLGRRRDEAESHWTQCGEYAPALFNRALASHHAEQPDRALTLLRTTLKSLPESSGWYHLAGVYIQLQRGS